MAFRLSVSKIIHDRGNGRRPNMVGMDKVDFLPTWYHFRVDPREANPANNSHPRGFGGLNMSPRGSGDPQGF